MQSGRAKRLSCKICAWLSDWFSIKSDVDCARQWNESDAWERAHSNESELWSEESDRNRELIEQAWAIQVTNPAAALRIYLEAAYAGSPWAMQQVGWHYRTGAGVAADFERAQDYYRRAICAGSWTATISYARLLAEHVYFKLANSSWKMGCARISCPLTSGSRGFATGNQRAARHAVKSGRCSNTPPKRGIQPREAFSPY